MFPLVRGDYRRAFQFHLCGAALAGQRAIRSAPARVTLKVEAASGGSASGGSASGPGRLRLRPAKGRDILTPPRRDQQHPGTPNYIISDLDLNMTSTLP